MSTLIRHREINPDNEGASEMWMSIHILQEIHNINDEIYGTRYDNLFIYVPIQNGISSDLSPAAIILVSPNPDYNKLKITFGAYAQVYIGTTNSTKQRTVGEIALIPANERGRYYFVSLATGKQLHAFIWTELPINDKVISRIPPAHIRRK